jgi:hypothetical protein
MLPMQNLALELECKLVYKKSLPTGYADILFTYEVVEFPVGYVWVDQ